LTALTTSENINPEIRMLEAFTRFLLREARQPFDDLRITFDEISRGSDYQETLRRDGEIHQKRAKVITLFDVF
jgi:hypothetical protein